jgi:pyrroloquinoline quinone (PQQ) biosynthesis protein C
MGAVSIDQSWDTLMKREWAQTLRHTAFLTRCRNGDATRVELRTFVRQQYFYSRHFTRYLNALLSNLPDERDRAALTQNLFEEMGLSGGVPHTQIYRRMMLAMHVNADDGAVYPATQCLIDTMFDCARNSRPMVGLGALCLGAEAIVPVIYSDIVAGFEATGEPSENLEFFTIHIAGDDEHAITMRQIIYRELARDSASVLDLEYGAARAIGARISFFNAISEQGSAQQ